MKLIMSACLLGLALASTLSGCERQKEKTTAPAQADNSLVALQKTDTVVGTGKEAVPGAIIIVRYTGWLYDPRAPQGHGKQFDSNVNGEPFVFHLGAGGVIKGWDEGLQGMKVGGKRTLIIPASMGYGASGSGPIPPNANLIFDVELLDVQ
jgi:FKBP-type peptidyl-prolyl cis-trans isomerase FkpA